jgi:hypothetical protein
MNDQSTAAPAFIARWQGVGGSERANYQLFVAELCRLLGVPEPGPALDDARDNAYVFERRVSFAHGDGSRSAGFIDCYRRGAFVPEAERERPAAAVQSRGRAAGHAGTAAGAGRHRGPIHGARALA